MITPIMSATKIIPVQAPALKIPSMAEQLLNVKTDTKIMSVNKMPLVFIVFFLCVD